MRRSYVGLLMLSLSIGGAPVGHADSGPADDLLARGRALYHGQAFLSGVVRAGDITLPPSAGACANCHGLRGEGSREGGVTVPGIAWPRLSQPQRGRLGYRSAREVIAAIENGTGRDGEKINLPMPMIALSPAEADALVAYLQVIGTEREPVPGVSDDRIVVGALLPLTPPNPAAEQVRAGLQARIAAINDDGGIFGRRIELAIEDLGPHGINAAEALERLHHEQRVFALVGSILPDLSPSMLQAIERVKIPLVATLGVPLQESPAANLTYLLPSLEGQLTQLVKELNRHCRDDKGIAVLYDSEHVPSGAVHAALADEPSIILIRAEGGDIDRLVMRGNRSSTPHWIVLGAADFAEKVRARIGVVSRDSPPCLATLAMLSGMPTSGTHVRSSQNGLVDPMEVIGLPLPATALRLLDQRFHGDALWSYLADLSVRVFTEALSRSGRILSYDHFERSMRSMHDFEPDAGVPVRFSPQQRHGLSGAHIWWRTQYANKQDTYQP